MSDEPKKRSRAWIWWAVAILGLYVLSIGPATGFFGGSIDPWPKLAYEAFYAPLYWVSEKVPPVGRAIECCRSGHWWRLLRHLPMVFDAPDRVAPFETMFRSSILQPCSLGRRLFSN
jgi:hypothetical protein